jgi:hypothetical protein
MAIDTQTQLGAQFLADMIEHWRTAEVVADDKWVWDRYRATNTETWFGMMACAVYLMQEGYQHPTMGHLQIKKQIESLYNSTQHNRWAMVMSPAHEGRSHPIKTTVWKTVRSVVELTEQAMIEWRASTYKELFHEEN